MARPSQPTIVALTDDEGIVWEILEAQASYTILYKNKPIAIRRAFCNITRRYLKYDRMTYTNLGNVKAAVKRLNERFNTNEFTWCQTL